MVTIKEAELLTGITRQNIRYYEKMGLIYPSREKENQYRKYNKDDIRRLKLIYMFRKLDMPLEEIQQILDGRKDLQEALEQQKEQLRQKQPLVHCITNPISINDCANALLAVGARPMMAEHPRDEKNKRMEVNRNRGR